MVISQAIVCQCAETRAIIDVLLSKGKPRRIDEGYPHRENNGSLCPCIGSELEPLPLLFMREACEPLRDQDRINSDVMKHRLYQGSLLTSTDADGFS